MVFISIKARVWSVSPGHWINRKHKAHNKGNVSKNINLAHPSGNKLRYGVRISFDIKFDKTHTPYGNEIIFHTTKRPYYIIIYQFVGLR